MVNSMLMRIHQSGYLAEISPERFELVKKGIGCYKAIWNDIKAALPFWPLKLPSFSDEWASLGLNCGKKVYLAVSRLNSADVSCSLPISFLKGGKVEVKYAYPGSLPCKYKWDEYSGVLNVTLPSVYSARLFEIDI